MIPIIDVDPFLNDDFSSSDELLKALGREGLIFITTKHITQSTRLQVIDAAKELFNLPLRDKMLIPFDNLRGYISTGNESGGSQFEYKEGFAYGFESSTSLNKLSCQNQWPQNYKDIPILTRFYNLVAEICMSLMKALSHALNVDRSEWEEKFSNSISVSLMRLFHYYPSRNLDNDTGSSKHTDWGFLTFILQDQIGGLEYFDSNEVWQTVPSTNNENSIVINCGDYLSIISGGKLKSPLHQVRLSEFDRYSFVFFHYPNYDAQFPQIPEKETGNMSLFMDQSRNSNNEINKSLKGLSFGDYIVRKWKQVERK